MSERHCEHGFADGGRCPVCAGAGADKGSKRRSVYEDRPAEPAPEEWRAEQLRAIGIGYGSRPLDQFLRDRRL